VGYLLKDWEEYEMNYEHGLYGSCDADGTELIHIKTCSNFYVGVVGPYGTMTCVRESECKHVSGMVYRCISFHGYLNPYKRPS
jgi:hypothetical protein